MSLTRIEIPEPPAAQPVFPPLQFTNNSLADVIGLINEGNIVALQTTEACRVFHKIQFNEVFDPTLDNVRTIYVNCNSDPGVLEDGDWEWHIHNSIPAVHELADGAFKERIIVQAVPNRVYVNL